MAYTTINKSTDYFNTKLYTGTGSSNALTGVGFQPDWVWFKGRNQAYHHYLFDAVRGVNKPIHSALTNAESTQTDTLMSFDSDGFTLGSDTNNGEINSSGNTFVSWNWKANGAGSANTNGNINTTVSANATAGFSIVKYTGNGSATATFGHGLNAVPKMIILKKLNASSDWVVYHEAITSANRLKLNSTAGQESSANWRATPTSSVFNSNSSNIINNSGDDYIAYCFAEKTGYSKFGSYTGNGNADGTFVYTGFKPNWVMIKETSGVGGWRIFDNKRPGYNEPYALLADNSDAETETGASRNKIDQLSNGFKLRFQYNDTNGAGGSYIYMAFGQSLVGSNNIPCTAF